MQDTIVTDTYEVISMEEYLSKRKKMNQNDKQRNSQIQISQEVDEIKEFCER